MRLKLGLTKCFWWSIAPLITGSIFVALPSLAATLASSGGKLTITNISQVPLDTSTFTDIKTSTTTQSGLAVANANAQAEFTLNSSTSASLNSDSTTFGIGQEYEGNANSISQVLGYFFVEANQDFTLDFTADLALETSIDNPQGESANAIGGLALLAIDTTTQAVYDSFSIFGRLNTSGDGDSLEYQRSNNIALTSNSTETLFGGTQESAKASIKGSLQNRFISPTNLTLVAVTTNQASVKTPESSNTLALLGFCGALGLWYGVKGNRFGVRQKLTQPSQTTSSKTEAISKV
jgi:hypothetical protein